MEGGSNPIAKKSGSLCHKKSVSRQCCGSEIDFKQYFLGMMMMIIAVVIMMMMIMVVVVILMTNSTPRVAGRGGLNLLSIQ